MTRFVWIFGPTAVGKETLIYAIASNPNLKLTSDLGLTSPIVVQKDAMVQRHAERDPLEAKISADRDRGATVLIKGQGHDIEQRTIFKLEALLPDDEFLYLFLDAPPDVIRQRREQRGTPGPGWDDAYDRAVNLGMVGELEAEGISFRWFDTSRGDAVEVASPPAN
jgi:hypothetical protein